MERDFSINNRDSLESQRTRQDSEFIKCVEDFARYVQKEYVVAGGRSLVISACERMEDAGVTPACHIMIGEHDLVVKSMASMMEDDEMSEPLCEAYLMANGTRPTETVLKDKRRQLRITYGLAALSVFWTFCLVALYVWGTANLITTISSLLMMLFVGFQIGTQIRDQRRAIRRVEAVSQREHQQCREHVTNAALQSLGMLAQKLRDAIHPDDDDDDEE